MSTTAVVSDKGQVTLPRSLRERLGIQPGSRLEFHVAADNSLSVQVLKTGADGLFGLLAKPGEPARTLDDMNAAVGDVVSARSGRGR